MGIENSRRLTFKLYSYLVKDKNLHMHRFLKTGKMVRMLYFLIHTRSILKSSQACVDIVVYCRMALLSVYVRTKQTKVYSSQHAQLNGE